MPADLGSGIFLFFLLSLSLCFFLLPSHLSIAFFLFHEEIILSEMVPKLSVKTHVFKTFLLLPWHPKLHVITFQLEIMSYCACMHASINGLGNGNELCSLQIISSHSSPKGADHSLVAFWGSFGFFQLFVSSGW